jgi:uncharacterized repeat protein (TIGR03847 family)
MPTIDLDVKNVDFVTVDALGQPGSRVFYLQAKNTEQVVTILLEKIQVQTMCIGALQFLEEIQEKFSALSPTAYDYDESEMKIFPPLDPLFRAGEIGLAYSAEEDKVIILIKEILTDQSDADDLNNVRIWCTRSQLGAVSKWGAEVTNRGRPICPQCGEPIPPEGHLCPKKNGHKK